MQSAEPSRRVRSQHQKFRKVKTLMDQLPALVSEVGIEEFLKCIEILEKLKDVWQRGGTAIVAEVSENSEEITEISTVIIYSTL